jgi:hypothetical protein
VLPSAGQFLEGVLGLMLCLCGRILASVCSLGFKGFFLADAERGRLGI